MVPYDLDKLKERARIRCIARGIEPTCLAIYHMVTVLRGEELRAGAGDTRMIEDRAGAPVGVSCVDE